MVIGLFLRRRALLDVEELSGHYEWRSGITAHDARRNVVAGERLGGDVARNVEGLVNLIVGAAYRDLGDDRPAREHLLVATSKAPPGAFKPLAHVLLANAELELGHPALAQRHYQAALDVTDQNLLRARLGSAETLLLTAGRGCKPSQADPVRLAEAGRMYAGVLNAQGLSDDPSITAKALFGRARAALCLSHSRRPRLLSSARADLREVSRLFEQSEDGARSRFHEVASEAQALLGLIDLLQREGGPPPDGWREVVAAYTRAIAISREWAPHHRWRRAIFRSLLEFTRRAQGVDIASSPSTKEQPVRLPEAVIRDLLLVTVGGTGSDCFGHGSDSGRPRLTRYPAGPVELGVVVEFCVDGFDKDRPLTWELRRPDGTVESQSVRAEIGFHLQPFIPSDPLGSYALVATQGEKRATRRFRVIRPPAPRMFVHGEGAQEVVLTEFARSTVVLLNLYRTEEGLYETPTGIKALARYSGTLVVVTDRRGDAYLAFPPLEDGCEAFRLTTRPPADADVSVADSPAVCI